MKRQFPLARARRSERGAIATLVAVLMAGGVVMGMLALTVDVGSVMYERAQLQNGADSTSLALASKCGAALADCSPDEVDDLLDLNAADNLAQYDSRSDAPSGACGRETGSALPNCDSISTDAALSDLKECPPIPSWLAGSGATIPYVETYSQTETSGGTNILPKFFSQLILGGSADTTVTACARAAWGPPGSYSASIPLTISTCEWDEQTANGTDWVEEQPEGPKPGYGPGQTDWPDSGREIVILLHDPGDDEQGCDWNGKDTAGGFGWVDSSDCSAMVTTNGWARIDTGADTPSDCKDILPGLVGTAISIPVFNCLVSSKDAPSGGIPTDPGACDPTTKASGGANSWYHIAGWAKFYISGYQFSGATQDSIMPGGHSSCSDAPGGGDRCLFGWFLKGQLDDATSIVPPGSGTDFGTYAVLPAG